MTRHMRLRAPPMPVRIPGDAQARLDSQLQTPLRFLWASREGLATERLSIGGELLRYGMSEWSGARVPLHPVDAVLRDPDEMAIARWACHHATDLDGKITCPVLVCDDLRVAAAVMDRLASDVSRGAVFVGAPDPRTPLPLGSQSRASASMALLLPGTPARRISWLGAESEHPAVERHLSVCADRRGLSADSVPYYLRAIETSLHREHCGEAWLIVFLDSLVPQSRTAPALDIEVLAAALAWFASFEPARGIVFLSVPGPVRTAHPWNHGEVARRLGHCLARRSVAPSLGRAGR